MNNSNMQKSSEKFYVFLITTLLVTIFVTSGCEPLRKKFTRKKKKDLRATELIPILDPVDYPAKLQTPGDIYRHHYSLWQVWQRDLIGVLEEKGSDKKITYLLNQILVQMEEMGKVLTGEPQKLLTQYIAKMQRIQEEITKPSAIRNNYGIKRKVDLIGKQVRQNLKFKKIEESLVP